MRLSKKSIFWIAGISLASAMGALCFLLYSSNCDYIALIRDLYGAEKKYEQIQTQIRKNLNSTDIAMLEKLLPEKALFLNSAKAGWTNLPSSILNEHPDFAILEPKYIEFNWSTGILRISQVLHIDWQYQADEVKRKIKEDKPRNVNATIFSFSTIRTANPSILFYKYIVQ